ncbi:MAG TPA: thiamine pyrophosphate-requiring protein [Chloroflexota bacterium]|nr:thiamine pyrophosphate-requiring protein [Chloroflexota bacterium]
MKGSSAVAEILKREGVDTFFCFPINPIIDAAAELGIRPIIARTERTVIGMADGYSRVTNGRRIGVAGTQFGPGVENSFGGVAQAFSDSTPLLFLPAGPKQNRLGFEPTFDAVKNFQYVTKWAARVNMVDRIPELLRRAFTLARTGRPGPVLLEMPMDVMASDLEDALLEYSAVRAPRSMASHADVAAAVKAIVTARKPLIHAGVGILYAEAWDELREFAELIQAPVMTTLQGKSAFPEDHSLSLGSGGAAGPRHLAQWLDEADLIFGAGSGLAISSYDAPIPRGKVAVQLTVDERDLNRDYTTEFLLMGDAKLVLQQMIEEAQRQLGKDGRKGDDRVTREVKAARDEWMGEWMPKLTSNEVPINPYRLVWDLQHAVDLRNTIATHDAGSPRDQMTPFWPALEPNSYIGWGKSTHLGYGIPLVLGAKVAKPEKTVLNVMGDLAFGMSGLELETAARNRLGTLTIVFNNGVMGDYTKHIGRSDQLYGTRRITGSYAKIAEGLGAYAERVEKPDEIIPAVKRALQVNQDGRPALLEVMTREETQFSKYWK